MNYTKQLNEMLQNMQADIGRKIDAIGKRSAHRSDRVIRIPEETGLNFCLSDGHEDHYVREVSDTEVLSLDGYSYNHTILTMGQLAKLTDYINTITTNY